MSKSEKYGWISTIVGIGAGIVAGVFGMKANQEARKEMKEELKNEIKSELTDNKPEIVEEDVPYYYEGEE